MEILFKNLSRAGGPSVVFDDDGRVCYAYFLSANGVIEGDVWLYNRCPTPISPEGTGPEKLPCANSAAYVHDPLDFKLPEADSDVIVRWLDERSAEIIVRGVAIGKVQSGMKPGWARAAKKNGPLAQPFL